MPAEIDPREVADVVELVNLVDIGNVVVYEERARRVAWSEEELADLEFPFTTNSLGMIADEHHLRYRFRSIFTDESAEYAADVEIDYVSEQAIGVTPEVQREFAERVAFMAVYPFIRASIFGSASRLGMKAPVLGIVRQGEFALGDNLTEAELQTAFGDVRSETVTERPT